MKFMLALMAVTRLLLALVLTAGIFAAYAKADPPPPGVPNPPTPHYLGGLGGDYGQGVHRVIGDPPGWFGFGPNCLSLFGLSDYCRGQGDLHPPTVEYPPRFP